MKKKRFLPIVIGYLLGLLVITYIANVIYVWRLPRVVLGFSESGSLPRSYELWGTATITNEYAGYDAITEFFIPKVDLPYITEDFGFVGDWVFIKIKAVKEAYFDGAIVSIRYEEEGAHIIVGYPLGEGEEKLELAGGEDVIGIYTGVKKEYDCIIPSGAVFEVNGQNYVYTVRERRGVLGSEFVAMSNLVYVQDEYNGKTSVYVTKQLEGPIVLNTDQELSDGSRVRFYP